MCVRDLIPNTGWTCLRKFDPDQIPRHVLGAVQEERSSSDLEVTSPASCSSTAPLNRSAGCSQCGADVPLLNKIEEFLRERPAVLCRIQAHLKAPLSEAAALNSLRWELYQRVQATGLSLETGSGGRTSWNRTRLGLPKTHWIDASCVGASTPDHLRLRGVCPLLITAMGRQRRQMCQMDRYGFPRSRAKQSSIVRGFRTGDMVRTEGSSGKKAGVSVGRVAVRATGYFDLTTRAGNKQVIAARDVVAIQRNDGYCYANGLEAFPLQARKGGGPRS